MPRAAATASDRRDKAPTGELDPSYGFGYETLGLGQEHKLIKPVHQERRSLMAVKGDLARYLLPAASICEQLAERARRVFEHRFLGCGLDLHLHLAGVLNPPIAHLGRLTITSSPWAW